MWPISPAICNLFMVHVHAAIDISDGFIARSWACVSSLHPVCVRRFQFRICPLRTQTQKLLKCGSGERAKQLLTGGDDYEIAMAVKPDNS